MLGRIIGRLWLISTLFETAFLFFQQPVDFVNQNEQPVGILLDRGLCAEFHPLLVVFQIFTFVYFCVPDVSKAE